MNFKTTLTLIACLAIAAVVLYVAREKANAPAPTEEKKLIDLASTDVIKVSVTPNDGKPLVIEKQDGKWRMTSPEAAPADAFQVDSLVSSLTGLQSKGKADA